MDVLVLIDKLDDTIHNAKPVPLTDQVRVDKEEIYDILNTLEVNLQKFTAAVQRGRDRLQGREEAEVG
jgi:hypothetical protein